MWLCVLDYYIFKTHLPYDMYRYRFMSRFCFLKYKYHNLLTHPCTDAWSVSHLSIENCYEGTYTWLPIFNHLGYVLDKNHRIITILSFSLSTDSSFKTSLEVYGRSTFSSPDKDVLIFGLWLSSWHTCSISWAFPFVQSCMQSSKRVSWRLVQPSL